MDIFGKSQARSLLLSSRLWRFLAVVAFTVAVFNFGKIAQATTQSSRPVRVHTAKLTEVVQDSSALSPQRLATRLSFALRGAPPLRDEVATLALAASQGQAEYLAAYQRLREKYLADPLFENRLVSFFADWWGLPQTESARTAAHFVFRGSSYRATLDSRFIALSPERENIYQATGALVESTGDRVASGNGEYTLFAIDQSERRFRSVLESLDFLDTYPDTLTNVNRKRAKQVFERFLCRPLVPDAVSDDVLKLPAPAPDQHVKDESCRRCHYKLDPVARFFDNWRPLDGLTSRFDSSQTAVGILRIFDPSTSQVSESVGSGLPGLAAMVRTSPDFLRCSVRHVWTFFAGLELPPQDFLNTNAELLNSEDELVRVIARLTEHPYFWTQEVAPPINFADVSAPLAKCGACHLAAKPPKPSPQFDLTAYPYAEDRAVNVAALAGIWRRIESTEADMMPPPDYRQIELSPSEIELLRKWISEGGRDSAGQLTLSPEDVKLVLKR
jgi:hypothetical protein